MLFWVPLIVGLIFKMVDPELFQGADQVGTILLWVCAIVAILDILIIALVLKADSSTRRSMRRRRGW